MEWIGNLISDNSGMIFTILLTVVLTLFSKMVIKIFRYGVNYSNELASKSDFESFKREIRLDMRAYKDEVVKSIMNTCMKLIEERLKDIDNVRNAASDLKVFQAEIKAQLKAMNAQYDELKSYSDNLRALNAKVSRLEGGNIQDSQRRHLND